MTATETTLQEWSASVLNAAGVATYKPTGGYLPTDTAIVFGPLPATPDRCVSIAVYGSKDDPKLNYSEYRLQFYYRGIPDSTIDAQELASSVFGVMQGLDDQDAGNGVHVIRVYRLSFSHQGIDENGRAERADNYAFETNPAPTTGRPN